MADSISNTHDIIDSRDVIERIDELESQAMNAEDEPGEGWELDDDEKEELKVLKKFAEEAEGYSPDWNYGATLIHEDHFTEYAKRLAEDIGAVGAEDRWPGNHVDWEAAANELLIDYTAVEFDGVTYYVR